MYRIVKHIMPLMLSVLVLFATHGYAKEMNIDIESQPLSSALTELAEQAGIQFVVSHDLLKGKTAPAVHGMMGPEAALKALLKNSGLEAVNKNDTIVIGKIDGPVVQDLGTLLVIGTAEPDDGSAKSGYLVDTVKNIGPWGEKSFQDTPYSFNVMSEELIRNNITNNTDQLFKINPAIQLLQPFDMNGLTRVMLRGFLAQSAMLDGMQGSTSGTGLFIDNIERVETMTGLSGFMYGLGNVGGTINYVTKRPADTRLIDITAGNYGGEQYYVHTDFGGPIDEDGIFGYRVNITGQDGDTALENQSLKRWMMSGAFNWHPVENILVGLDAMHGYYKIEGRPAQWTFSSSLTEIPSTPDNDYTWSSPDTFNQNETDRIGADFNYDINSVLTIRANYGYQMESRRYIIASNTVTSATEYTMNRAFTGIYDTKTNAGYAYADAHLGPFGIANKVTFGFNGYTSTSYYGTTSASPIGSAVTNLSLLDPASANIDLPDVYFDSSMTKTSKTTSKNYLIGDDITFNDEWSMLAGLNHAEYTNKSYTGSSYYSKSKTTPTFSVIYKPLSNFTTYVTYIESLEQGRTVTSGSKIYTNDGAVFEPMASKQYEIGSKVTLGKALLTAALFKIEKANTYDRDNNDGTYTAFQNGKQTHQGLEIAVFGKATDDLTLFGGFTLMDAEVNKSTNQSAEGKIPQGVAERIAKMSVEYNLPFIEKLILTSGLYYIGKSFLNVTNTQEIPAYTIMDAGLRYTARISGYESIFRLLITNLTDKEYWMSNYTIGAMSGAPRIISFSGSIRF